MKKWIVVFLVVFFVFIVGVYLFIPNPKEIKKTALVQCSPQGAYRYLLHENNWLKVWPEGQSTSSANSLTYNNNVYKVKQKIFEGFVLSVQGNVNTEIYFKLLPLRNDSVAFEWKTQVATSANPFTRISINNHANSLSTDIATLLTQFKNFFEQHKKVYGIEVKQQKVKDTVLMSAKRVLDHYPTTPEIYSLIDQVKVHISKQGGKETNHPMLHIDSLGNKQFTMMVGIPVDKVLGESGSVVLKRMVLGNILEAEVRGGLQSVDEAAKQLEYYVSDYKYSSPAIPYQQLVTDRLQQPDTSKWVTRLYYPVF